MRTTARSQLNFTRLKIETLVLAALVACSTNSLAQNEWALQTWTVVKGSVKGEELGKFVTGLVPGATLNYRAAISRAGHTELIQLSTPQDTSVREVLPGVDLLAGDLNGDGYTDFVLTQTIDDWDTVLVYWGTSAGIDKTNPLKIPGENRFDEFHAQLLGDVNNDGFLDLICATPFYPNRFGYGKIYFFLGPNITSTPQDSLVGGEGIDRLGARCVIGDIDGDGLNDLAVKGWAAPLSGGATDYVNVYLGKSPWLQTHQPDFTVRGFPFVFPALALFDVNGDGIDDLLWTTRDLSDSTDWVYVHYGGEILDTIPDLRLQDPGVATFGHVLANAGDMNGDGYDDIAVGAHSATITIGLVFVFGGGPNIDSLFDGAIGLDLDSEFGWSVSSIGDVNADGLSDLVIGAPAYQFDDDRGFWGVFLGSSNIHVTGVHDAPPEEIPTRILLGNYPNPFNSTTTIRYELQSGGRVSIRIYDVLGKLVSKVLSDIWRGPGSYTIPFDASGLSSGTYICELIFTDGNGVSRGDKGSMILLK